MTGNNQKRETALAAAMEDRTDWERATRHQRQLAVSADAEPSSVRQAA